MFSFYTQHNVLCLINIWKFPIHCHIQTQKLKTSVLRNRTFIKNSKPLQNQQEMRILMS